MAIIYAYPEKATPAADDLLILSDSASTDPSNKTKTVKISSLPGATGNGITSLNGQTLATQSFANDTNVTITSAGGTHTLGWAAGSTLATARGGTGSSSTTYCDLTANVTGILPIINGGTGSSATKYCSLGDNVTGTLGVTLGGTGLNTLTPGGILLGSGAADVTVMAVLADGAIVIGDGATDPVPYAAFSSSTGTLKVSAGGTGSNTLTSGYFMVGNGTSAVTMQQYIALGSDVSGQLPTANGGTGSASTTYCSLTANVTGTLPIANGGTGETTAQEAIDALSQVSGATDEYILTKDTGTGNAVWKANAGDGESGFSPYPIYTGTEQVGLGDYQLLMQSVVDASFTLDSVKFLNTVALVAGKSVTIGIYTGDLTTGVGVLRAYGEFVNPALGINTLTFTTPYYFNAGDSVVIYYAQEAAGPNPLGFTGTVDLPDIGMGKAAYSATPNASLATELVGYASANGRNRVCMHFYDK